MRRQKPLTRSAAGLGRGTRIFLLLGLAALAAGPSTAPDAARSASLAVIPIKDEITDVLRRSVERRLEDARAAGAKVIVFELHTPGGLVTSALDICRLIKNLPADVTSVAWVNHEAYSAGAMISVACKKIYMSPSSAIGDCAPIMVSPTGGLEELPATERAKAESPVLQEFRDSAASNGYDPMLCRAMVTVGEEVWWIQSTTGDERRFVSAADKKKLIDDVAEAERKWKTVESLADPKSGREQPLVQPVDRPDTLLTLSQSEAVAFGFASGIVGDLDDLVGKLGQSGAPLYLETSGWETFAMWLNSPWVRGFLFMIVVVGGYIEFSHPGLMLPGITALVALAIFLGAPYAAGLADIWTFVLLGVGLALLAVEIFLLPGFGVAGILGGLMVLGAFLGTFIPREPGAPMFSLPNLQGTWDALKIGIFAMSGGLVMAMVGIVLVLRFLPQLPVVDKLILSNPSAEALAPQDPFASVGLVGDVGLVISDLRPGGQARFGNEVVDVQSQGKYVEAGKRVQVIKRDGGSIIVRPLTDEA
ncbi:hypothetical protein RAS1_32020 [Phycisphaerae bacterium RAS1]|nr:hypothetical protein RAS1_32020 [Phycisphaerae bacterium RAS1]